MLIIVQNDPEVPAGTYADWLKEMNVPFRLCMAYAGAALPPTMEASAVIVLGGAMGVNDTDKYPFLLEVKLFIGKVVAEGIPFLGICLGGQLLADIFGAPVTSGKNCEKGSLAVTLTPAGAADPLFAGIDGSFTTFQWHNDTFAIPQGGVLLVSSPVCPNQAFRHGKSAYGLQFHPEMNAETVDVWARWTEETAPRADEFLAAFARTEEAYRAASWRLLANFIRIAGLNRHS